ncbi:MAG TPA: LamG domain-containing protein [Kofleriaceae bacterium]|nr:LamG domain-containing protein [Kofleriaceae bacterium]
MRCALLACLLVACYHPNRLDCSVSCANGASCPDGLTCGATDQLCHSGSRECTAIDAVDAGDDAPSNPPDDASFDGPPPVFCSPALRNLVACYELDGTTDDSSPNHLNAATASIAFQPGRAGLALAVDMTSRVRIMETTLLDLEQFTVEAWIDQLASTNGSNVTVVNNPLQYGMFVDTVNEPTCAYFAPSLVVAPATTKLQPNQWTHLACTYDGVRLTLYINGAVAAQNAEGGMVSKTASGGTGIGSDAINVDPANHFVGLVDGVRIFSAARTAAEICADADRTDCR